MSEPTTKALRALGRLPPTQPISSADATLIVKPREAGLQAKEIPVEKFLGKVVSMRDKLRVLEQRVNASKDLGVDEKIGLESDITQLYQAIATLTAFFSEDALGAAEGAEASE